MTRTKKNIKTESVPQNTFLSNFDLKSFLPEKFHVLAAILVIFLLVILFLNPLFFGGKSFTSGDIIAFTSMKPFVEKERDGISLWNPSIFCGMPSYALGVKYNWYNSISAIFYFVRDSVSGLFSVEYTRYALYLILMGISAFFLMKHITKNSLVSLFVAVSTAFSTGLIVFLFIGHVTKLSSLAVYPLVFLILLKFQEKIKLLYFLTLVAVLQILIVGFHVQIIFYTLFAAAIYFIYYFFRFLRLKEKEKTKNLIRTALAFAAAFVLAILISAPNLTQVYEYTPFSTRGTKGIIETKSPETDKNSSAFYDYHTSWSFSPGEVLTFLVPSYYGFGVSTYKGPLTNDEEVEVNTYFGQMPFVDVAMYMGVLVFALALFAVFTRWKDPFVRFLTIVSLLALIISFGKNFPILFDLLFYYLPGFDKFRVPSMMLVIVQMSIPVLAGLGLMRIIEIRKEKNHKLEKILKNTAYVFTGMFVLSLLLNQPISDWFVQRVQDYAATIQTSNQQLAQQHTALANYTAGMFSGDLMIALAILASSFWLFVLYTRQKISADILALSIIFLCLFDLFRINSRGAKYTEDINEKTLFATPDYINIIKSLNDSEPFRILNLKQDRSLGSIQQNTNFHAHFLVEDFYGYSGIKPRAYQDIMDVVGPVNETLWRMLNVKYLIFNQQAPFKNFKLLYSAENTFVYENQNALPRFFFVDSVEKKDNLEYLRMVESGSFDPRHKAFIHDKMLQVDKPDSTASIKLLSYKDEVIELEASASGNNFMFFGNTFMKGFADYKIFKPSTGWKAYIDEKETEIYRTNHGFMGIVVPAGKHKVTFSFAPESFDYAKYISLVISYLTLFGLAGLFFLSKFQRKKSE
ncbi:MAG: YfhO family protein [Ignavibacteriaceae bacterium]|nr:YfhO family protein [Ignavibacteriaceae bacterium]